MKNLIVSFLMILGSAQFVLADNLEKACADQAKSIVESTRDALSDFDREEIRAELISKNELVADPLGRGREYTFQFSKVYAPTRFNPSEVVKPIYKIKLSNRSMINGCDQVSLETVL